MIKLIWFIATINAQGPVSGRMDDTKTFPTVEARQEYAGGVQHRIADWVRGNLGAELTHPVEIKFNCDPGQPV